MNYPYTLRNIPEERRSQIYGDIISVFIVLLVCVCARVYFSGCDNHATDIHFQAGPVVRSVILTSFHGVYC